MELISDHLAILHFQICAGFIEIYAAYLFFSRHKLVPSLILFSEGIKNILNLIVIAFPGSMSEKYYCCIDMGFSFFQCIFLLTFVYHYFTNDDVINYSDNEILNKLEWNGKQVITTIFSSIFTNLEFVYLIIIGAFLVPAHDYLPFPGILIGTGVAGIVAYSLLGTKNELIRNFYFVCNGLFLLCIGSLMILHQFMANVFLFLICDFVILIPRIIRHSNDRRKPNYKPN